MYRLCGARLNTTVIHAPLYVLYISARYILTAAYGKLLRFLVPRSCAKKFNTHAQRITEPTVPSEQPKGS